MKMKIIEQFKNNQNRWTGKIMERERPQIPVNQKIVLELLIQIDNKNYFMEFIQRTCQLFK